MATDTTKGDVNVRIGVDEGPLVAGLKRIEGLLDSSATELASRFALAERAYEAVQFAVRESIGAAIEAEVSEQRLTSALRQRGYETTNVVQRLTDYNTALALSTGIGDDNLLGIQSTLVALGANQAQLEQLTMATLGLAEVTGKNYGEAARDIAKVAAGNTSSLRELGLEVGSVAEAIELLADKSQLLTDRATTTQGRIDRLKNSAGELGEEVGRIAIGKGNIFSGWLDRLLGHADDLTVGWTAWLDANEKVVDGLMSFDLGPTNAALEEMTRRLTEADRAGEPITDWVQLMERLGRETKKAADETARLAREAKAAAAESSIVSQLAERFVGRSSSSTFLDRIGRTRNSGLTPEQIREAQAEADLAWKAGLSDYTPGASNRPGDAGFVGPVDPDTQQFMLAEQSARMAAQRQEVADLQSHKAVLHQLEVEANEARFQAQLDAYDAIQAAATAHNDAVQATANAGYAGMMSAVTGFAGGFAQVVGQAIAKRADFGTALKSLAGESIVTIGQMLFQLGTAGVLAGTLGTFIPFFATLTGGPLGVAAGSAAAAAGLAMIGIGSALGASATPAAAPARGSVGGGGRSTGRSSGSTPDSELFPRSSLFGGVGEGQGTVLVMNIYGGLFGGDSRGVARDFRDILTEGESLLPTRRRRAA